MLIPTDIKKIINKTLEKEGGYTFDKDDPGGETKFGISQKAFPKLDISALTIEEATEIYYLNYYLPLDLQGTAPINYKWKLFDIAVNLGISVARKFKAIIDELETDYPEKIEYLCGLQAKRYEKLMQKNPILEKYRKGWMNRAGDCGLSLLE